MWIVLAFLSSIFAALSTILAKCGIKQTGSTLATALRTVVVLVFSWLIVLFTGKASGIAAIEAKSWIFLVLSGLATGASWLCYFRAIEIGEVNKVVAVDKTSVVLTIVFGIIIFQEEVSVWKALVLPLILCGTLLMSVRKPQGEKGKGSAWFVFAALSAVFASLTSILAKIGIQNVDSNLATAIRTTVVLVMSFMMVSVSEKGKEKVMPNKKELLFIALSGIATGASWLCYFSALKNGQISIVAPIDKLSVVFVVIFSWLFLGEKAEKKSVLGLLLMTVGTLMTIL